MGKLGCKCGYVISDNTDYQPHAGSILKDQDEERYFDGASKYIASYLAAVVGCKREDWIRDYFSEGYPLDLEDEMVISDILSIFSSKYWTRIYECSNCGRVWIQEKTQSNRFLSFKPDTEKHETVLKSEHYSPERTS